MVFRGLALLLLSGACVAKDAEETYWIRWYQTGQRVDGVLPAMASGLAVEKYRLPVSGSVLVSAFEKWNDLVQGGISGTLTLYADRLVFDPHIGESLVYSSAVRHEVRFCDIQGIAPTSSFLHGKRVLMTVSGQQLIVLDYVNPFSFTDYGAEIYDKMVAGILATCESPAN